MNYAKADCLQVNRKCTPPPTTKNWDSDINIDQKQGRKSIVY